MFWADLYVPDQLYNIFKGFFQIFKIILYTITTLDIIWEGITYIFLFLAYKKIIKMCMYPYL